MSMEFSEAENNESSVLRSQLDAEEVVNKLAMTLRCRYYDDSQGKYIKADNKVKPYLNEEGISKVSAVLRARISNSNQYSRLSKEEIRAIRLANVRNNWKVLCVNKEKFELDITQLSTILDMLDDALHLFLSRTEKGGFLAFIKGIFKGSESYSETSRVEDENKGGIFNLSR